MSEIENTNFVSPTNFRMLLQRAPHVEYFVQAFDGGGLSLGTVYQPTPLLPIPKPGDQLEVDAVDLVFKIDEDFKTYNEMFQWMKGLGHPDRLTQYKDLSDSQFGLVSDASVLVLNSNRIPKHQFVFRNCFPIYLSLPKFDVTDETIDYVYAHTRLRYEFFDLESIG